MKISLSKVRVIRNTCGLIGAALMLCHCGTGAVSYLGGTTPQATASAAASSGPLATTAASTPSAPSVAGMTSGFIFDAATSTGTRYPASDTTFYTQTATSLAQAVTGANAGAVVVVGKDQSGTCVLGFPQPQQVATDLSGNISFAATDQFEALLTALDNLNAKVILEVEPGFAPSGQLASLVMATYGQHTSVVGFGINLAYNAVANASETTTFSDSAASYVLGIVQTANSADQLYLRASQTSMMPATTRTGLVFIDDQSGFASQADQLTAMQAWAAQFSPSQVAFSIGAQSDASWWCSSGNTHAVASLVAGLLSAPPTNLAAIFWSADSLGTVFPTQTCSADAQSASSGS